MTERLTTTVKWYSEQKGFGFLVDPNGGADIFVHVTGLNGDSVRDGQKVTYEIGLDQKKNKPCAVDVRAA